MMYMLFGSAPIERPAGKRLLTVTMNPERPAAPGEVSFLPALTLRRIPNSRLGIFTHLVVDGFVVLLGAAFLSNIRHAQRHSHAQIRASTVIRQIDQQRIQH